MDAVQKQAVEIALALCMVRKSNSPAKGQQPEENPGGMLPRVSLSEYDSCECFSIFMSRINTPLIHDKIMDALTSHALKEMSTESNEVSYQEHIGRTLASALSKPNTYYQRFYENYSELCSVLSFKRLSGQPSLSSLNALLLAQFHVEVLLRAIVQTCHDHLFELNDNSQMHQRLVSLCELFYIKSLQLIKDYDIAVNQQEDDLTAASSLHFIHEEDIASVIESIGVVSLALKSGQKSFKEWLVQSVAVAVDSEVHNFPNILDGLVSLARSID